VRGSRFPLAGQMIVLGSIPARAGEPSAVCRDGGIGRVYPRACGGATWTKGAGA